MACLAVACIAVACLAVACLAVARIAVARIAVACLAMACLAMPPSDGSMTLQASNGIRGPGFKPEANLQKTFSMIWSAGAAVGAVLLCTDIFTDVLTYSLMHSLTLFTDVYTGVSLTFGVFTDLSTDVVSGASTRAIIENATCESKVTCTFSEQCSRRRAASENILHTKISHVFPKTFGCLTTYQ